MQHGLRRLCGAGALVLPLSVWLPAMAQQPLVEDLTSQPRSFYQQTETREEAGGSLVLFNQVQEHQEELRQLRGQVEELRHQLEQLRRQTRQQYMDIEDRLAASSADVGIDAPSQVDDQAARQVAEASSPSGASADAQAAYQAAFAHVQAREFDRAIDAFNSFVGDHPDNNLTANAHYWLGELHAAEGNLDEADAAFRTVLDDFSGSSKVPDALYKLGLLKARQGQPGESRELLERVRDEYPDSSAAGLANDFLRQSGN
ncbi:tol-pal system protein YbgF [Halomonas urumqiensis]|uniref:Cell division coordinator CpoB n=1 Tax=Halomonas urumqiensis TaxID=1684789 RepID=A0A2N7UEQ8_9GAMM|nr:tol-pal system protein YbgF [Halomonas urumqiensis]PMR78936.1 tol-pal system protein YbgF [Halomonas urumqiensis]PTB04159.1 tol-pal system protein YbgF [Halomonas urumqiensis]GHE19573.1 tol-pal system protein YbgF [Halomonas urumqiensis]